MTELGNVESIHSLKKKCLFVGLTVHCKCLQGIMGVLQGFPVVGKPCNIYRLRGNPRIIMGFLRNL